MKFNYIERCNAQHPNWRAYIRAESKAVDLLEEMGYRNQGRTLKYNEIVLVNKFGKFLHYEDFQSALKDLTTTKQLTLFEEETQ